MPSVVMRTCLLALCGLLAACAANTARLADADVRPTDLRECAAVRGNEAERRADGSISIESHRRCDPGATWSPGRESVPAPDFRTRSRDP